MNKIRVIDLLNKIANGEEVPKVIKYDNVIFELDKFEGHYLYELQDLSEFMVFDSMSLNDEVEIIEEDKKIEKIDIENKSIKVKGTIFYREKDIEIFQKLSMVINEIIDYLEENK